MPASSCDKFHKTADTVLKNRQTDAPETLPWPLWPVFLAGLQNIMIFSKISKYQKYNKCDIFDIFQKMKISNKLYNNGCNTLMQYLMTLSYQSFVPYTLKFSFQANYTTLRSSYGISRPSLSVVCDVVASTQRIEIFGNIFAPSNSLEAWAVCVRYA